MPTALLGLGSNIDAEAHLRIAAQALRTSFEHVVFASVYQSAAVGMKGDDFLNTCCFLNNVESYQSLTLWCKNLEDLHGRDRTEGSWKPRTLDLDILMFDDEILDDDLEHYAHVFVPAAELVNLKQSKNINRADVHKLAVTL